MKRYFVDLPDPDLAYLVEGTPEFDAYITAMLWAQEYAELLTADGQWVKAPVLSFGRQEVSEVTLSRSGVIKTIRATAEHRWLLRSRRGHGYEATTTELQPGDRLQFTFPPRPNGLHVDLLAAARGFVYGDGHRHGNRSAASFVGSKDAVMLPLFEGLGCPPRTYGDVGTTGRPTLSSASLDDLEFLRLLCRRSESTRSECARGCVRAGAGRRQRCTWWALCAATSTRSSSCSRTTGRASMQAETPPSVVAGTS